MKVGSTCTVSSTTGQTAPTTPGGSVPSSAANPSGKTDPSSGTSGSTGSGSPGSGPDPGGGSVDPLTGAPAGNTVTSADGSTSTAAAGTPVSLAAARTGQTHLIGWLVAAMLALTVLVPPFLISRNARRPR
jgi:hypothetical protein